MLNSIYQYLSNMSQYKRLLTSDLKKPLIKKKKTTHSFNKKDYKEYYQHQYTDAYAENMILGRVNDDCLAEIFMYLPLMERPKVALVCKKWRQVLHYSWIDVKKLELTQWNYDVCPSYMNKYPTINGLRKQKDPLFRFLKSLLGNCGRYLSELDLTVYGHCNILPVISKSCRNVVELRLKLNYIIYDINSDTFAHLSKLQVLKIIFESFDPSHMPFILITLLRNVAKTLTKLSLSYWSEEYHCTIFVPTTITNVITELKALKIIELFGFIIDYDLYKYLKSSQITVSHHHTVLRRSTCIGVRYPYKNIKNLELLSEVTNDCLYSIANCMEQLRALRIICQWVFDPGVIAISKMKNLLYLDLLGNSAVTESSIILLKNFKMLGLPYSNKITDYSVTKILENSPKIEVFRIRRSAITSEFVKKAAEIAENRQTKLYLRIEPLAPAGSEQYESRYLDIFGPSCKSISGSEIFYR